MSFDKYQKYGAYHWATTYPGRQFWRYNPVQDANYSVALSLLRANLESQNGRRRILDIACGDGVMAYKAARAGISAVGVDFELLALKLARDQFRKRKVDIIPLLQGTCAGLPVKNSSFDGAVAMELIEHLDEHNTLRLLAEMGRIIRPHGVLVITTPNKITSSMRSPYHTQEFTGMELKSLLDRYFDSVSVYGYFSCGHMEMYSGRGFVSVCLKSIWKLSGMLGIYNPFGRIAKNPGIAWEHLAAVARVRAKKEQ